jgi:hypothetical protein
VFRAIRKNSVVKPSPLEAETSEGDSHSGWHGLYDLVAAGANLAAVMQGEFEATAAVMGFKDDTTQTGVHSHVYVHFAAVRKGADVRPVSFAQGGILMQSLICRWCRQRSKIGQSRHYAGRA